MVRSRKGRKPRQAKHAASPKKLDARSLFDDIDAVIRACRAALLSEHLDDLQDLVRYARKRYAEALRQAGSLSFTKLEVQMMDLKSTQLEDLIGKLVARCAALASRDSRRGLVVLLLASLPFQFLNHIL